MVIRNKIDLAPIPEIELIRIKVSRSSGLQIQIVLRVFTIDG